VGGGIYAVGATLTLSNVRVTGNQVIGAAGGVGGFGGLGHGGSAGASGTQNNPPGGAGGEGGGGGKGGQAGRGGDAYGGGLYLVASRLTLENNSVISGNLAAAGTGGVGGFGGYAGSGGAGGAGGRADPQGGQGGNGANGGDGGDGGQGGLGGLAAGGGMYALNSTVLIVQGSVTGNKAIGGQGGIGGFGGGGGPGGPGGNGGPPLSPWAVAGPGGNGGNGGNGGAAGAGGDGGDALAGGIYAAGGSIKLLTAQILANKAVPGPRGPGGFGGAGGTGGNGGSGNGPGNPGVIGNPGHGGAPGQPGTAVDDPDIVRDGASSPKFLSSSRFTFTAGQSNSFLVSTHGYPLPALTEAGLLPAGVTFRDNGNGTATLSGKPAAGTGGIYTLTFTAVNGVSPQGTQTFTLTVQEAPGISSPNSAALTVGQAGSISVSTTGYPAATLKESGPLPAGVSFTDNGDGTGTLKGTPLPGGGGTYTFTLTAQNGLTPDAAQTFTLTVDEAPQMSSASRAVLAAGAKGSFAVTTLGFPRAALTESGALPSGVAFHDNGDGTATLGGTPAVGAGGFYHFTITAHNGAGADASQGFTLLVGELPSLSNGNSFNLTAGLSNSITLETSASPTAALAVSGLPAGFTFHDNGDGTGTLKGSPAAGTTATYQLVLLANNGFTAALPFTIDVGTAPTFTSPEVATFTVGQRGLFTVRTSGGGSYRSLYDNGEVSLIHGLTFTDNNDGTATISGTPAAGSAGSYNPTITVSSGFGSASQFLTINVGQGLAITTANNATWTVGQSGSVTITTSGSPTPTLTESGALPSGLTFTDNGDGTATISGTSTAGTDGADTVTITAHNGTSPDFVQTFYVFVQHSAQITSDAAATFAVGNYGAFSFTTSGLPEPTLTESGALPSGVSFYASSDGTASLSGYPAAGTAGTYHITITAHNGIGSDATQDFTLTVGDFTSSNKATFRVGQAGSFTVSTTGFSSPTLTIPNYYLPSGLTFTDNGDGTATISGTPDAETGFAYHPTVGVWVDGEVVETQDLTVIVDDAPQIESDNSTTFMANASNAFTVSTYGLPEPSLTESGALPAGVTFHDNSDGTATLAGNPPVTANGTYHFTITAHNGLGSDATQNFTLTVGTGVVITTTTYLTGFVLGGSNSFAFTTAGNPTATLTEDGGLPSGVTFTDNGDGTATLAGTPAAGSSFDYSLTITADNGVDTPVSQSFDLYIYSPTQITSPATTGFVIGDTNDFTVTTSYDKNLSGPRLTETGNLPSGVYFDDNGDGTASLNGYPYDGTAGTYTFTITANEYGEVPDVTQSFTLVIGTAAQITSANSALLTQGTAGKFTVTATGTPLPTLTESGALPAGVSFTDDGDGTATFSGTPAAGSAGTYHLTLTAHNGVGSNATQSFTLTVGQAPAITSGNSAAFAVGQSGTFALTSTGSPKAALTESGALPAGVTFTDNGNGTATLAGTPLSGSGGTYQISITAHNGTSSDATQSFTLTVSDAPKVTSAASTTFAAGAANTFTVITYGYPAPSLTESGDLPAGVTFTDNGDGTATLAGSPSLGAVGAYSLNITAHNSSGGDATQSLLLVVGQAPDITSDPTTVLGVGRSGTFTVTSSGIPFVTLTASGTLPAGVTFQDNGNGTATLSGTPAAGTAGMYQLTLTAHNGVGGDSVQNFFLLVGQAPAITSAAAATFGIGGAGSFTVITSGSPAASLTESGALPAGVTFTDNGDGTATLSGTPAAGTAGAYPLTLTASNGAGADATRSFTLTVSGQAPAITSGASATLTAGHTGNFTVTATGSPTPTLTASGALPAGVTFKANANGTATLSGTPAAGSAGTYHLTITATANSSSASQDFTLTINDAPQITSAAGATFAAGAASSFMVTSYGTPVASLTVSGALPSGVTFADNGDGTATLGGTLAAGSGGTYHLTLTAHNGVGSDATQTFTLTVGQAQAPAITSTASAAMTVGQSGTFTVTTTGLPAAGLAEAGVLPAGVTFKDNGDGTATLAGTPAAGTSGTYSLAITAANGIGTGATQSMLLTIKDAPKITSPASATFAQGNANTLTVTTYGLPVSSLTESGSLPSGVTFRDNGDGTATLSGTPAAGSLGVYRLTLTAHNGLGSDATQSFTLTVTAAPNPYAFESGVRATFTAGQSGQFVIDTYSPTGAPYALTEAGALPSGLSFHDNGNGTATISGTPAATSGGTYAFTVTASHGPFDSTTQAFTLTVQGAPSFTSPASATFFATRYNDFTVTTAGSPGATLTVSGALPNGVTVSTYAGSGELSLSGGPQPGTAGMYHLTITAHNGLGSDATQDFTLTVQPVPSAVFNFTEGQAARALLAGGVAGRPALAESGALPSGIAFTDNGDGTATLSGTPLPGSAGTYLFTVAASVTGSSQTLSYVLNVNGPPRITSKASAFFTLGRSNYFSITSAGTPTATLTESGALPSGLTFSGYGGRANVSGTPAAGSAGVYHLTITAHNGAGADATQDFTLVVGQTPSISYGTTPTFTVGQAGRFTVTTNGNTPPLTLTASGALPPGLTFTDNGDGTATLAGTPAPGTGGSYALTVTVSNGVMNNEQGITLRINEAPAITSAAAATFVPGSASSFTITTAGYPAAQFYEVGALPTGVTFTDNGNGTAMLAGTPAAGSDGTYHLTINASNGTGDDATQNFTLTVGHGLAITSTPAGTLAVGQSGSLTITAAGSARPTLTASGALPGGVTFTDNGDGTATLGGTPTGGGTYHLVLTAHNGGDPDVSQGYTLTVTAAPGFLSANTGALVVGVSYLSAYVTATGYPQPTLTESGTLPDGVTFQDYGYGNAVFTGTPAAGSAGTYNVVLTAHNGSGADATQNFALVVGTLPAVTSANKATFTAGQAGTFTVTTSGTPVASLTLSGALPSGVTFTDNGNGTATLAGTPAAGTGGTYSLFFVPKNVIGSGNSQFFTLTVNAAPQITSSASATFTFGQYNSLYVTTNGYPAAKMTESGALPSGVSFSDFGDGSANLSGTPASGTAGTYTITVTADGGTAGKATQTYTLTVVQAASITSAPVATFAVGQAGSFTVTSAGSPTDQLTESGALPSGITFADNGDGTATLSGTPAAGTAGAYRLAFTAHNGVALDAAQDFILFVNQGPVITSANHVTLPAGQAGSFTVTTAGSPAASLTESGALPSGVSFMDNGDGTATLGGTPAAGSDGSYTLTLTAHNGIGSDATQTLTLTVGQTLSITSGAATIFTAGQAGTFTVTTTGSPAPALTRSGALPTGVTFTDNHDGTATLAGTPAAGSAGIYSLTITAHNGVAADAAQTFTLTVGQAPAITSGNATTFTAGQAGSFVVRTTGVPTASLTESGALPSAVTFTDNHDGTATLAGTPAVGSAGTYMLTLTAHNGSGSDATQTFTLKVQQAATITSGSSTAFTVGQGGTFTVTTTGSPTAALTESGALPGGVTFTDNHDGTATLAGTPAVGSAGTYTLTLTAHNGIGSDATQTYTLKVQQAAAITSANATTFAPGQAGSFTVITTGSPAAALSGSGTLPSGVTFTDNGNGSATLGGTPASGSAGTYTLTLTAHNGVGSDATQTFTLTVGQLHAPAITSGNSATLTVGQGGTFTVTTTGSPTAVLTRSGTLPPGVSFTDNHDGTATLAGTPAASTGTYVFTVTATNGAGTVTQVFTLTVIAPPTITSAGGATFTVGKTGAFTITTTAGLPAATTLSRSGTLPGGVTFAAGAGGTATIKGTPAAGSGGTYALTLTAANATGQAQQSFTLTVSQAPAITSARTVAFTLGRASTFVISTTGFPRPALTAGTLPAGLTFLDNGNGTATISGTPAAGTVGSHAIALTASNGVGTAAPQTLTLTINQAPAFSSGNAATFTVGQSGTFTITTTPGSPPTTTVSKSGTLPGGATFTAGPGGTATLKGKPAAGSGGTYAITLTAGNGAAQTQQSFTLTVNQAPAITSARTAAFTLGRAGTFTVSTSGFPHPALTAGALPDGLTFTDNGDGTATIGGTPAAGTVGPHAIILSASNGVGSAATQTLTLTVNQAPAFGSGNAATFTVGQSGTFTITTTPGSPPPTTVSKTGTLPGGVTFTAGLGGTATLKGKPAAGSGGTYAITLTAGNGAAQTQQSFTLTVNQAPAISSARTASFTVGRAGTFTVNTTGFPHPALTAGALPDGLTFTDNGDGTATISGTPAAGTVGPHAISLSASNGVGSAATQTLALTINQAPAFSSGNAATFTVGQSGTFAVTTTPGSPATTTVSKSGTLPGGVTFTPGAGGTATLKGKPAAGSGGTYAITLTAGNGAAQTQQSFTLTVNQAPAISSARTASFMVGRAGTFTVNTTGFPHPALTAGALPDGLTFTDNGDGTATISGTPAAGTVGLHAISLSASNGVGSAATQNLTLTINQAPAITSAGSTTFTAGSDNRFTLTTTGYPAATLRVSGTLPAGVTFVSNGDGTATLKGRPAAGTRGTFSLTITASDGLAPDAMQTFVLTIA
jgi:hypothetical protein